MAGFTLEDKIKIAEKKKKSTKGKDIEITFEKQRIRKKEVKKKPKLFLKKGKALAKSILRSSKGSLRSPTKRQIGSSRSDPFAPIQKDPFKERIEKVESRIRKPPIEFL